MESTPRNPEMEAGNGPTTYNLLYVCSGNTCRSPLARVIAEQLLRERGWGHVKVDSAGTAAVNGAAASDHAILVARELGLDLDAHESKAIDPSLVEWADLILVMTPAQFEFVTHFGIADKVALATDFIEGVGSGQAIRDPFGGDMETYRETVAQLRHAAESLLARLEPILAP